MYVHLSRWERRDPIAERLTFSSFSQNREEFWASHIERPFQIVVMPGYAVPEALDRASKDAMWIEDTIKEPLVVWDGFAAGVLFEVIRECFDPEGTSPHIKVYDRDRNAYVEDGRDPSLLAIRPVRPKGLSPALVQHHLVDVLCWLDLFRGGEAENTRESLFGMLKSTESPSGQDAITRKYHACRVLPPLGGRGLELARKSGSQPKVHPMLKRGPVPDQGAAAEDARQNPPIEVGFSASVQRKPLDLGDIRKTEYAPGEFYRMSVEKAGRIAQERDAQGRANTRQWLRDQGRGDEADAMSGQAVPEKTQRTGGILGRFFRKRG